MLGRLIEEFDLPEGKRIEIFNVPEFAAGVYLWRVKQWNEIIYSEKLVIIK